VLFMSLKSRLSAIDVPPNHYIAIILLYDYYRYR
jgi:hypothetical protein